MAHYYKIELEVLTNDPIAEGDQLDCIASAIDSGSDLGNWKITESRELSAREAYAIEIRLGGDGCFSNGDAWVYGLSEGDEVKIHKGEFGDVADVFIQSIEWLSDDTYRMVTKDGETIKGTREELE